MKTSHIMCTSKILTDLCFTKQNKTKQKKIFCKTCLQCFSNKNVMTDHKEVCLSINGTQSVKLGKKNNWNQKCFQINTSSIQNLF